tara:strand:- start:245 stop:517 length:273 start_codon:yes stop_codon:yes gene_type:complete
MHTFFGQCSRFPCITIYDLGSVCGNFLRRERKQDNNPTVLLFDVIVDDRTLTVFGTTAATGAGIDAAVIGDVILVAPVANTLETLEVLLT